MGWVFFGRPGGVISALKSDADLTPCPPTQIYPGVKSASEGVKMSSEGVKLSSDQIGC